jgi:putative copper export protein/nitrogen fixation protein FixH
MVSAPRRGTLPAGGRALLAAAWLLAVAGLGMMVAAERSSVGTSLGNLLASGTGQMFVLRGVVLAVTGVAVGFAIRQPGRVWLVSVGYSTAAVLLVHAVAGHAGASGRFAWFNVADQWFHLLAVGVWVGGLAWLLLGLRDRTAAERAVAVRRFSWMAGIAIVVVAATGIVRAVDDLGGPLQLGRLIHTSFGVALLVKLGLFVVLALLGAVNRYTNVPGTGPAGEAKQGGRTAHLRRTVMAEVLVAAGILGATAVMSELPPAALVVASTTKQAQVQRVVVSGSDFATTVRVRLTVTPGTVGANRFDATVSGFDTGQPVRATAVTLQFSLPSRPDLGTPTVILRPGAPGSWGGQGTVLSIPGTWEVEVVVQEPTGGVSIPLHVTTRVPPEKITVQRVPGQLALYTIALDGGASLQAYVDPGRQGTNQVHFTFFQASGSELPIASATATLTPPGGAEGPMPLIRFDAGHFVSNTSLTPGTWRFAVQATGRDGHGYAAYFSQQIGS